MYAVIKTGGKQYRVAEGDVVRIERVEGKVGKKVNFEVLAVGDGGELKLGSPLVAKGKVSATIVEQGKDAKVRVFKFKKNSQYRILRGHRQPYTAVKIGEISAQ